MVRGVVFDVTRGFSARPSTPSRQANVRTTAAVRDIEAVYRPGFNFSKAGVMLLDLQDGNLEQGELDLEPEAPTRGLLMEALDKLNDRYGRGTVVLASAGMKGPQRDLEMKQNLIKPQYTTCWNDLPVAKA